MKNYIYLLSVILLIFLGASCTSEEEEKEGTPTPPTTTINAGNDPNFKIVANEDEILSTFNRKVVVFGINIYAPKAVEDVKLLHAANIMAQYLDNNEDGTPDNQLVVNKMIESKAFLIMWKSESDFPTIFPGGIGQDLGNDETIPGWHTNGRTGRFDASLEEVLHLITNAGFAKAYPEVFGEIPGTSLANAMDIARGGNFLTVPNPYPASAWYTYDDTTCDYNCQASEYIYWALTSILGAQDNRLDELQSEWKLNTKAKVQATDTAVYNLLTDSQYKFPTVLPNGAYKR